MICHARVAAAAIGALAIPVIEPGFPTLLITPVGLAQLFPTALHAAWLAAIGLPAITGEADEKHRPAAHGAAKQLSQYQSRSHCLPGGSGQWPSRCATLKPVVVVLSC